ncbi:MAG: hypothetical protein O7D98_07105 [Candidatus Dadabacteria bacterium]|nr:hypothetical protein [Candidatus Dadabacteria bacterium]
MSILKKSCLLLIFIILCLPIYSMAQKSDLSPLGFHFGINKKEAIRLIDSNGKRIVENEVDSKKIRTILMQGVIVSLPIEVDGVDVMTGLEFYDKKLLSTSLIFAAADEAEKTELEDEFIDYFTQQYGEPVERDSIMYFTTTTWHMPDIKLVLHTNEKNNTVKVEYTYKPVHQSRIEKELDTKRGTVHKDPATSMFLDGDYSKPKGYDERYGIE